MTSREQLLATTFVDLADTLVADFDFLHTLAINGTIDDQLLRQRPHRRPGTSPLL
jgi:hypothetical protein